jgi:hypothetical protein
MEYEMKCLALAAAGAAVIGLAACSHSPAPAGPGTVASAASAAPVNCRQQYSAWANGQGKGLVAALSSVSSAATAGDAHVLTIALKNAKPAVARAAHHPMPTCADPKGYWSVLLMHVNAAAAGKSSASSVRAAMKGVPEIEHKLVAELKRTAQ